MRTVLAIMCASGVLICVFRYVNGQPSGKFYSGPGLAADGTCPIQSCATDCKAWQYRAACSFNSSGYCTDCTNVLGLNKYFSATGGLSNNCEQSFQRTCTAGFVNLNRNSSFAGTCTACSPPSAGIYFTAPSSPSDTCASQMAPKIACAAGYKDVNYNDPVLPSSCQSCGAVAAGSYWTTQSPSACISAVKDTCQTGYSLTDYASTTSKGTCERCADPAPGNYFVANPGPSATCTTSLCIDTCGIGEYKKACGSTNPGICSPCTNGNASQIYTSSGGLNNVCKVAGCSMLCDKGEFIFGCGVAGAVQSSLSCQKCNNSIPNYTYYTGMGAYLNNSCPTTTCPTCLNGFYAFGCGGVNPGTCTMCTNTV
jgi:hypothetical protein